MKRRHMIWYSETKFLVDLNARRNETKFMSECSRRATSTTFANLSNLTTYFHRGMTFFFQLTFVQTGKAGTDRGIIFKER
jgi:hypothetical protein